MKTVNIGSLAKRIYDHGSSELVIRKITILKNLLSIKKKVLLKDTRNMISRKIRFLF